MLLAQNITCRILTFMHCIGESLFLLAEQSSLHNLESHRHFVGTPELCDVSLSLLCNLIQLQKHDQQLQHTRTSRPSKPFIYRDSGIFGR